MKMPPNAPENRYSQLLNSDENVHVFKLLGNRCQSISTTVAQLYSTEGPNHAQWVKRDVGVLCFVKDNIRKNYFFRLFCLRRNMLVWEHEMYNNMEYIESTYFLHTFEGESGIIGFNFPNPDEARHFKNVVEDKILMKIRRDEKRSRQPVQKTHTLDPHDFRKVVDPNIKAAKRKRNITKADISSPSDFKHISHVGWNPDSGFDIDSQDEQLKCFFEKAGISEKQLQDRDTKEFIYNFINKHGGREAVEAFTNPIPQQPLPPVPPVPPRGSARGHVRTAPPPPPPPCSVEKQLPPPPPPMNDFEAFIPPPPPPMMELPNALESNDRSALFDSIKSGITLKPKEDRVVESAPVVEDSRNQLLKQIQGGTKLKPACERELKPIANTPEPKKVDLAEALARALADRKMAIHSDEESDTDSNDDEWME